MQTTIKAELVVRSRSITDLWATRGMLRRTLVAVGVQVFGQFSGINVINYFGPSMYRDGMEVTNPMKDGMGTSLDLRTGM